MCQILPPPTPPNTPDDHALRELFAATVAAARDRLEIAPDVAPYAVWIFLACLAMPEREQRYVMLDAALCAFEDHAAEASW